MLIHLTPTFFCTAASGPDCKLIDMEIPELGLKLVGGKDLAVGRPFPNKNYLIGYPKKSRKALIGILIETAGQLSEFTAKTRWAVNADFVLEHEVTYIIPDQEFDAVTDQMMAWDYPRMSGFHTGSPVSAKPVAGIGLRGRERETDDTYNAAGQLVRIKDRFVMPTIQRSAIDHSTPVLERRHPSFMFWDRHPAMETMFTAGV